MDSKAGKFIALGGKGDLTGSVWILSFRSNEVVTRNQFVFLSMPNLVVQNITVQSHCQYYTRGEGLTLEFPDILKDEAYDGQLPEIMTIGGRDDVP